VEEDVDDDDAITIAATGNKKSYYNYAAAHSYASALLHVPHSSSATIDVQPPYHTSSSSSSSGGVAAAKWMSSTASGEYRQRATEALADVDRKLALIDGLSQRITRESPESIAGPLLRSHGHEIVTLDGRMNGSSSSNSSSSCTTTITLHTMRDKAERIERQSRLLDAMAKRVEETLRRGTARMEAVTLELTRVLELSSTLKMMLRLQFESRKVLSLQTSTTPSSKTTANSTTTAAANDFVDLRDLTRAAASVAAMEGLLSHPSLTPHGGGGTTPGGGGGGGGNEEENDNSRIHAVEKLRPRANAVSTSVRKAAAGLMDEIQRGGGDNSSGSSSGSGGGGGSGSIDLTRLGATLQVYFHLGELPDAA
jgi:hypothetical protein